MVDTFGDMKGGDKMKLTEEQRTIVEENHALVYWYANLKGLNLDEWYDLLCIELCYTVMKHDPTKSSLSNYFKLRADNLVHKEYAKTKLKKRSHNGLYPLSEMHDEPFVDDVSSSAEINELFFENYGIIVRLKSEGYTQSEIAEQLGITQSYVSKTLAKIRDNFYENDR